jgi:hypothetical protein
LTVPLNSFITSRDVTLKHEYLHNSARRCVRSDEGAFLSFLLFHLSRSSSPSSGYYVLSDLVEVNEKLQELEKEDEIARSALKRSRLWTTKSRRRTNEIEETSEPDGVERFVEQRRVSLDQRNLVSSLVLFSLFQHSASSSPQDMKRVMERRDELFTLEREKRQQKWAREAQEEADKQKAYVPLSSLLHHPYATH